MPNLVVQVERKHWKALQKVAVNGKMQQNNGHVSAKVPPTGLTQLAKRLPDGCTVLIDGSPRIVSKNHLHQEATLRLTPPHRSGDAFGEES